MFEIKRDHPNPAKRVLATTEYVDVAENIAVALVERYGTIRVPGFHGNERELVVTFEQIETWGVKKTFDPPYSTE